jgi:hypothetical protein
LQPLTAKRAELETAMADPDHRTREAAANALAELVARLHVLEEEWLEVASALDEL